MFDDFLFRAVVGGIGVALVAGPLGCFIVWRRMAYFGDTVSHSGLLGVALGLLLGVNVSFGVLAVAVCIAACLILMRRVRAIPNDTLLGILSHASLSIGLVVVAVAVSVRVDLLSYLFGDILAVGTDDIALIYGGGFVVLALLVWLAAIPIAAHAAAEASFEVSQVSGLRGWQPARTAFTAKGGEVGAGRVTVSLPASARWRFGRLRVAASIATKPTSSHGATCRARVPRPHAVMPFRKSHHPALHAHTTTEREPWFAYELLQDANDEALGRCGQRSDAICGRGNQNARGCGCHCDDGGDGSDGG